MPDRRAIRAVTSTTGAVQWFDCSPGALAIAELRYGRKWEGTGPVASGWVLRSIDETDRIALARLYPWTSDASWVALSPTGDHLIWAGTGTRGFRSELRVYDTAAGRQCARRRLRKDALGGAPCFASPESVLVPGLDGCIREYRVPEHSHAAAEYQQVRTKQHGLSTVWVLYRAAPGPHASSQRAREYATRLMELLRRDPQRTVVTVPVGRLLPVWRLSKRAATGVGRGKTASPALARSCGSIRHFDGWHESSQS